MKHEASADCRMEHDTEKKEQKVSTLLSNGPIEVVGFVYPQPNFLVTKKGRLRNPLDLRFSAAHKT